MTCGNNHPLVATSGRVIDVRPLPASPRFTMQTEQLHSGHSPDTSSAALDDDEAPHETQSSRSTATPDDATAALDAPTRSSAADIAHLQSTAVKERSTREAFRLYLKESGVVELFTSALVSLYNEAHQPDDAIEYIRLRVIGDDASEDLFDDFRELINELVAAELENVGIESDIAGLQVEVQSVEASLYEDAEGLVNQDALQNGKTTEDNSASSAAPPIDVVNGINASGHGGATAGTRSTPKSGRQTAAGKDERRRRKQNG